ncbi:MULTISPECIES: helix-turn-helix transcriptional regulator [unclassified Oceanispirochaeta]|uniref:ArsR/SmtB family transcription factor n=1 Tax=unclassified Oceanispirochaeta TaxID=2635722 RepID=UPI000E08CF63|nr:MULTISPECIES: metalloregulator ArsR/SmtB family transcription factor [unclassified Oceanispirochaeta]MBF9018686.1 winged helix-turn-helix transcriptional regulator [Oceanispirochaeta sp. M2]NPD75139.1 winged helix-turn-helix transcriptional regulator [Oceanispirochaeta sp. M1]RDG29025.1 ArsR family transcriptional regulator [Oceanispirochaeta sp. M1]
MISDDERKKAEIRAHMFKALAHPVRIYFLEKLKEKTWCVCKLAEEAGIPKSAASKHLSQLKEAGLVDDSRVGTRVEYKLTAPCVLELAACAEGVVLTNRRKQLEL